MGDKEREERVFRCIVGPTASGKTALALRVAKRTGAEILSVDSMKVYRGMDIGTAKPAPEEQSEVRFHLIDILDPSESYSVARFIREAERAFEQIRAGGKRVLFVGGTALYMKALTEGLFEGPAADREIRRRLKDEAAREGTERLHERLAEVDPHSARRIHGADIRRIVRALEVYEITGRPISEFQREFGRVREGVRRVMVGLRWSRDVLYRRIEERVEAMFRRGFLDEVRRLAQRGGRLGQEAGQALGYKEAFEYLKGKYTGEADLREEIKKNTRRFAKRQITWFKHFEDIRWIDMEAQPQLDAAADQAARHLFGP
jgi:tRNA dimethylallyltransferase